MQQSKELPADRLATTDAAGKRVYLYPSDVRGRYRSMRVKVRFILILLFPGPPLAENQRTSRSPAGSDSPKIRDLRDSLLGS